MNVISFIDTTILCNLVPVPGFDQHQKEVAEQMSRRLDDGEKFILPITSVIETGNHIAQLGSGHARRGAATKLDAILRSICAGQAPWVLHDIAWNQSFLQQMLDGGNTAASYIDHAQAGLGAGDLCILTERQAFTERSRIPASIWTLDAELLAHA